jgi:hypothetical protein
MCPSSTSDAYTFTELEVKEVSSAARVFDDDDTWSSGICKEVEGLCARTGVGVAAKEVSDILVYVLIGGRP